MPGIVVFRRRWLIASDDFVFPALLLVVADIFWAIVCALAFPYFSNEYYFLQRDDLNESDVDVALSQEQASDGVLLLRLVLFLCLCVELACIVSGTTIVYVSSRGTIANTEPRRSMPTLIAIRLAIVIVQLIFGTFGIVLLFTTKETEYVPTTTQAILIGVLCWHLSAAVAAALFGWSVWDSAGDRRPAMTTTSCAAPMTGRAAMFAALSAAAAPTAAERQISTLSHRKRLWKKTRLHSVYAAKWDRRVGRVFCCAKPNEVERTSVNEVSELFADFFTDFDLIPTDILAGLILLRKRQRIQKKLNEQNDKTEVNRYLSGIPVTAATEFIDWTDPDSHQLVRDIRYYMSYALASYGWPFYLNENRKGSLWKLLGRTRCCSCICGGDFSESDTVLNDNCCLCHSAAVSLTIPADAEVIYANFHGAIGESPFYVALDRKTNEVIVCIRGTLSTKDLITDLCANLETVPFPEGGSGEGIREGAWWGAHHGSVKAAIYVRNRLQERNLLEMGLAKLENGATVRLIGHSLGGAAATVLGLMLREQSDFHRSTLKCSCYSPPGGLLNRSAAIETRKFVISTVVGKDVVARLGLDRAEPLRNDIVSALADANDPKWKILASSLPGRYVRLSAPFDTISEPTVSNSDQMRAITSANTAANAVSEQDLETNKLSIADRGSLSPGSPPKRKNTITSIVYPFEDPLLPPGRLLHVVRTWPSAHDGRKRPKKGKPGYTAIWTTESAVYDNVWISPVMVQDHMPQGVIDALDGLLKESDMHRQKEALDEVNSELAPLTSVSMIDSSVRDISQPQNDVSQL